MTRPIDPKKATVYELLELAELEGALQPDCGVAVLWARGQMKPNRRPLAVINCAPSLFEGELVSYLAQLAMQRIKIHAEKLQTSKAILQRAIRIEQSRETTPRTVVIPVDPIDTNDTISPPPPADPPTLDSQQLPDSP